MRTSALAALPFAPVPLAKSRLAEVDCALDAVEQRFQLDVGAVRRVVSVYLKWCSPSQASPTGLRLTATYLAWFFAINDLASDPGKQRLLLEVRGALHGEGPAHGTQLIAATRSFAEETRLEFGDARLSRYLGWLDQMFDAFSWEISHYGTTPSSAEYWRHRVHFVAVYPYLELWRLALGVSAEALDDRIIRLEQLSVELTLLVNDLLSVERDKSERKHNLVFCVASERNGDWSSALNEAVEMTRSRVTEFEKTSAELALCSDATLQVYVAFLGSVAEGTRLAMLELRERYPGRA
jgi:hypothetical protein